MPTSTAELRAVASAPGFSLQLGACRQLGGAESLLAEVAEQHPDLAPKLTLQRDGRLTRVQLGPLPERDRAERVAERLGAWKPVIVLQR